MDENFGMGLKPLVHPHFTNPFTEVNDNITNSSAVILPSALADGFDKLLWEWALATFGFMSLKCLIQKVNSYKNLKFEFLTRNFKLGTIYELEHL